MSVKTSELTRKEKSVLFWASFIALAAGASGFAFRVVHMGGYQAELGLTFHQAGQIFGATLWPSVFTRFLFSFIVDKIGYRNSMYISCTLQLAGSIGTAFSNSYGALYFTAILLGLGHGIVCAVIDPACAAVYPKEKTKKLTILHAAWPAGLAGGTLFILIIDSLFGDVSWRIHSLWIIIPALIYGFMFLKVIFPVGERVKAGIPYIEMLRQLGFLGFSLISFMLVFEMGNQVSYLFDIELEEFVGNWFYASLIIGIVIGAIFAFIVKSVGRPLFFLLCLLMIPVATAELGTDQWIKNLMTPVLQNVDINPKFALIFSASIMLIFRMNIGKFLKYFTPPSLLAVSGFFSAIGLLWLSNATGIFIFIAFVTYAVGQTFYWPCILGFVSERYPEGGALTINTVSAIGILSVGIIGGQLIGAAFDRDIHKNVTSELPKIEEVAGYKKDFLWQSANAIDTKKKDAYVKTLNNEEQSEINTKYTKIKNSAGRSVLAYSARFPIILVIAFSLIFLYFKRQGGYKPIELEYKD